MIGSAAPNLIRLQDTYGFNVTAYTFSPRRCDRRHEVALNGNVGSPDSGREQTRQRGGTDLLYMIIENFRNQDPVPVYRRFRDRGRLASEDLRYVSSWVDLKLERCFQLMETERPESLDAWLANWSDLVEFEVYPVISSKEAAERVSSRL